jgi:XRE family transcriptional regulator of biofilm formation
MIGKNIHENRIRRGLTLTELAKRAGIAKSYLSNLERNLNQNPSINVMERIAFVLDVDLKALLKTGTDTEIKPQKLEEEWIELVNELKESGIDKAQIQDYKTLLEFIKWKKEEEGNK